MNNMHVISFALFGWQFFTNFDRIFSSQATEIKKKYNETTVMIMEAKIIEYLLFEIRLCLACIFLLVACNSVFNHEFSLFHVNCWLSFGLFLLVGHCIQVLWAVRLFLIVTRQPTAETHQPTDQTTKRNEQNEQTQRNAQHSPRREYVCYVHSVYYSLQTNFMHVKRYTDGNRK